MEDGKTINVMYLYFILISKVIYMVKKREVMKLEGIYKTYQMGEVDVHALSHLDLSVYDGEHLTIQGPSGSGKSTLLHILGLLDDPSKGKVYINGKEVSGLNHSEMARLRSEKIGFVFQSFYLIPSLTAMENVMLPLMFMGVDYKERFKKAKKSLESLAMGDRFHHRPSQLSGGERQRVAIARAIVNDPMFVLADEPTGNLDTKSGKAVMDIFNKLNKQGRTLVIITHDNAIAKGSSRVLHLKDGTIVTKKR